MKVDEKAFKYGCLICIALFTVVGAALLLNNTVRISNIKDQFEDKELNSSVDYSSVNEKKMKVLPFTTDIMNRLETAERTLKLIKIQFKTAEVKQETVDKQSNSNERRLQTLEDALCFETGEVNCDFIPNETWITRTVSLKNPLCTTTNCFSNC